MQCQNSPRPRSIPVCLSVWMAGSECMYSKTPWKEFHTFFSLIPGIERETILPITAAAWPEPSLILQSIDTLHRYYFYCYFAIAIAVAMASSSPPAKAARQIIYGKTTEKWTSAEIHSLASLQRK